MSSTQPPSTITDEEFAWFREFFGRKTGIYFEETKRYFVDRRLEARMKETGHETCGQYLRFVQLQPSQLELQRLVNAMTVNETYFFREEYQLQALATDVLADVMSRKRPGQPIRIWSIPCSTGEEPYSVAIYLLEHWPLMREVDVEIVGSDINSDVLETCRRGVYGDYSIRNLPKPLVAKYFKPTRDGRQVINDEIREAITFSQVNVVNPDDTRGYRGFDVVLCRNLLIYFDDYTRRAAVETLFDALNPGGYIFLGHSESMSRISSIFKVARVSSSLIYQRPL